MNPFTYVRINLRQKHKEAPTQFSGQSAVTDSLIVCGLWGATFDFSDESVFSC